MDEKKLRMTLNLFDGEGGDGSGQAAGEGQTGTTAEPEVLYGRQEPAQGPEAAPEGEPPAELDIPADPEIQVTSNSLEEKRKAFQDLIHGEYKDLYQQELQRTMDQRFRRNRGLEAKLGEYEPLVDMLKERYGVGDDLGQLRKAIESDDSYWESAAEEAGMSTEQYKEFSRMRRENARMRQDLEQRQRTAFAQARIREWTQQAEAAKAVYPELDLNKETQNPQFMAMLKAGTPVQHAYEVMHLDAIKAGVAQNAAQAAEKQVTDNVRARGNRPTENGVSAGSGFLVKNDVSKLTKKDRAEIARRVARGEKITF